MEIDYMTLRLFHILGAMMFVGNIIVTALWKAMADQTKEPKVAAFGQRLVTLTDFVFTGLGAGIVLITGLLMAGSLIWTEPWLAWGLGLFTASGVIWAAVLIPIQVKQSRLARSFAHSGEIPEQYWRLGRVWMIAGTIATILPLINVYFMVFTPS